MNLDTVNIFVIGSRLDVPEKLISRLRTSSPREELKESRFYDLHRRCLAAGTYCDHLNL